MLLVGIIIFCTILIIFIILYLKYPLKIIYMDLYDHYTFVNVNIYKIGWIDRYFIPHTLALPTLSVDNTYDITPTDYINGSTVDYENIISNGFNLQSFRKFFIIIRL